jgi:hypothetical protein
MGAACVTLYLHNYSLHILVSIIHRLDHIQFQWIHQEQNKEADKLTCRAYEDVIHPKTYGEFISHVELKSIHL